MGGIFIVASFLVFKIFSIGSYVPLISFEDVPIRMLFGDKLLNKGQYEKAIAAYTSVLEIAEKKCDYRNLVKCLLALGLLHWNVGELDASLSYYEQAYEIASTHKLKREVLEAQKAKRIYSYYQKGKELKGQRKYQESIQMFDAAIKLAKELGSKHHELKCIRQMSINHWEMSEFEDFYVLNEKALHYAEDLNHVIEIVRALNHIGLYYWRLNQYSQALVAYSKSLDIVKLHENMGELSTVLNNIGIIYKEYGNFNKALEFLFEALRIDRKAENDDFCAIDLINIGTIYRKLAAFSKDMGDFQKSIQFFEESLGLAQKNGDINTEIAALNNLGDVFIHLGDYKAALKYLNKGIEKANATQKIYYAGVLYNNIGLASHGLLDSKASLKYFYDAVAIGLEISSYDILWEAYYGLGLCNEKAGNDIRASEYFKMSADVIDKLRSRITLDVDKAGFAKDKIQVYHRLVELYFRHFNSSHSPYHIKSIFKTIERAKARAFLDLLNEANVIIQDKLTPELVEQENKISESIAAELNKLAHENHSIEGREFIIKHLDLLEDKYTSFMNKVRVEIPELSEIVSSEPCSLEQVQSILLDNETILLEYFLGEERSFLLAITDTDYRICELPAQQYVQDSLKAYLKLISDGPEKTFKGEKASLRLYNELVGPVEDLFGKSIQSLIIVPDGILYYLPFESLIMPLVSSRSGGKYLVNKYNVSYMPSASSLLYLITNMKHRSFDKDLLALGNPQYDLILADRENGSSPAHIMFDMYNSLGFHFSPLPHSEKEIRSIAKYFDKYRRDIFSKSDANERRIKNIAQNEYRVIHFACHGFVDEIFPLRSALVLSSINSDNEDGFLLAREIYNLRLGSDMIVLSACQTGKGKIESGEGILGLQRVFFFAGARSVVSTLWEIGDKPAALFMQHFYKYLSRGFGKSNAIRLAKIKMLESPYSHPFFWAGFILSGEYQSSIF